jgi:hypothetical protein
MKKFLSAGFYLLFYSLQLAAQSTEQIIIKAGDDIATGFSPNGFFRFPAYTDGSFALKDGRKSTAKFNYNIVSGEMHFLGPNNDTLTLAQPGDIEIITIGTTPFIYNKGFIEIVGNNDLLKLGKKIVVKWETESVGAYGLSSPTASIDHFKQIITGNSYQRLTVNQNVVFNKTTSFWLIDKKNNIVQANRKNFLKLYPSDKQSSIDEYIKQNSINFNKEDQLTQLIRQFPG